MKSRLDILCGDEWNMICLMEEAGIRNLGEFKIVNGVVDYNHLDDEVEFSVGQLIDSNILYAEMEKLVTGAKFNAGYLLVYLANKKPRYLLNVINGLCLEVEVE